MKNLLSFMASICRLIFVFLPVLAGIAFGCWFPGYVLHVLPRWVLFVLCTAGAWFLWLLIIAIAGALITAWRRQSEAKEDDK